MKIEIGDFVMYQSKVAQESKKDIPTIALTMVKVTEITGNGKYFKDKYDKEYENFRVRFIFRKGFKEKIDHDGYDEERCIQEIKQRSIT
jgi:hypothetical protein